MAEHCGTCTLCCKLSGVKELNKPMNEWCTHCIKQSGCSIYETRPQSCRDYACMWLLSQSMDNKWPEEVRPNRCHVVMESTVDGQGLVVRVDPVYPDAWQRGLIGKAIQRMIKSSRDVIIVTGDKRKAFVKGQERAIKAVNVSPLMTELVFDDDAT